MPYASREEQCTNWHMTKKKKRKISSKELYDLQIKAIKENNHKKVRKIAEIFRRKLKEDGLIEVKGFGWIEEDLWEEAIADGLVRQKEHTWAICDQRGFDDWTARVNERRYHSESLPF